MAARKAGSSTFGDSESETFSGPSDPATKPAGDLVGRLPGEARALDVHLGRVRLEPVVGLPDRRRRERVRRRDVGAGREVGAVDVEDDLRPRQVEQVGIAGDVARVVARSARRGTPPPPDRPLDQHAPRAVEQDDPLAEQFLELLRSSPS